MYSTYNISISGALQESNGLPHPFSYTWVYESSISSMVVVWSYRYLEKTDCFGYANGSIYIYISLSYPIEVDVMAANLRK